MDGQHITLQLVGMTLLVVTIVAILGSGIVGWAWRELRYQCDVWLVARDDRRYGVMSYEGEGDADYSLAENAPDRAVSPVKGNAFTEGNGVAIGKSLGNDPFAFPDLFTGLARIVLDKKLGETDAIKIAIKVMPGKGDKYQEARRRLHAAMERESPSDDPLFRQDDGTAAPASRPVTGQRRPA